MLGGRMITVEDANKTNVSGIQFFQDQEEIDNDFEVRVENDLDLKGDLLQILHCQALLIEENKDNYKIE